MVLQSPPDIPVLVLLRGLCVARWCLAVIIQMRLKVVSWVWLPAGK